MLSGNVSMDERAVVVHDESRPRIARDIMRPRAPVQLDVPHDPPIASWITDVPKANTCFDNYVHQSGRQRAYLYCKLHYNCRLYIFVGDHGSHRDCATYLQSWHRRGKDIKDDGTGCLLHVPSKPTAAEVAQVHAEFRE